MQNRIRKRVVIIGAGISGATAARELNKLGYSTEDIIILEQNDYVGGKLKTYTHHQYPQLKTEYGAGVLTHNYGIIDTMMEKNIDVEKLIPTKRDTVEILEKIDTLSSAKKITFGFQFGWEILKFGACVWSYKNACNDFEESLPDALNLPFAEFAERNNLNNVATFLQFLVPGFGYGSLDDENTYTYRMLAYMGYTTIPSLALGEESLVCVHNGYQQVVEKTLENFNVQTSVTVQHIERDNDGVEVQYVKDEEQYILEADLLVLTMSPLHWNKLGMDLSDTEQECVNNLTYYRYPVAICRLVGLPANQLFIREAFEKEGFGHAAFLFTRDNRPEPEDGRLCTIYINLPSGPNDFSLEEGSEGRKILEQDLLSLPGVTEAHIDDVHIWEDYNSIVKWETGISLQKEEMEKESLNTIHLGSYLPDSFETVAGAEQYARKAIGRWHHVQESFFTEMKNHLWHGCLFFQLPRREPINHIDPVVDHKIALGRQYQ